MLIIELDILLLLETTFFVENYTMKRTFTLIISVSLAIISKAQQIPEGTTLVGGAVGFSRSTLERTDLDDVRATTINLTPSLGKFYRANRVAGINLNYSHSKSGEYPTEGNYYGIGFFLRQYLPIGKSFYVFAEENINGQTGKYSQKYSLGQQIINGKQTSISLNAYPGIAYAITRKFQLELALVNLLSIVYTNEKRTENISGTITNRDTRAFSLNAGSNGNILGNLSVGAKWLFVKS
jgi:hypothetical protein